MKKIDYHGALGMLEEVCAGADMTLVVNPLQGIQVSWIPSSSLAGRFLWKVGIIFRHLGLVFLLWGKRSKHVILVREFSTVPLLIICPLLLPLRNKLVLTVNHNLQWAMHSRSERFAFSMLDRLGFRYLFFEMYDADVLRRVGVKSSLHWVLPHPVSGYLPQSDSCEKFTVGFVGHYREEKGVDGALGCLLKEEANYQLILGFPNIEEFRENSRYGDASACFELRDTSGVEDYHAVLSECDVVLLCYTKEGYEYRASGIIADAAAFGTVVLVPNFPVLNKQISAPVSIGMSYSSLEEIPACIKRISENISKYRDAFPAYAEGRSVSALSAILNKKLLEEGR